MGIFRSIRVVAVLAALCAIPAPSLAQLYVNVSTAPPMMPQYVAPPPVPQQNDMWTPGYWAYGQNGYYWVPGTYVQPPAPNTYWTPPYWSANTSPLGSILNYVFNQGYWAPQVGYYGGVDYGAGYYGNGYTGGMWQNGQLMYNTAVTPVNTTVIHNVYVNRTVIVRHVYRYSYYGPGGSRIRPTPAQLAVMHMHRIPMTPVQRAHMALAARDRTLWARNNGGHPRTLVVARPLGVARTQAKANSAHAMAVRNADRAAAHAAAARAAAARANGHPAIANAAAARANAYRAQAHAAAARAAAHRAATYRATGHPVAAAHAAARAQAHAAAAHASAQKAQNKANKPPK